MNSTEWLFSQRNPKNEYHRFVSTSVELAEGRQEM